MAQKKITDLQLRDNVEDTVNFPADDTIQSYRVTAAQVKSYILPDFGLAKSKLAESATYLGVTSIDDDDSPYTVLAADDVIVCDTSSGAITITPPSAASFPGREIKFIKKTSNFTAVTITGVTGLHTAGESVTLASDGSSWIEIDRRIPSVWTPYSLSITGTSSNPTKATSPDVDAAFWKRDGDSIKVRYSYSDADGTGAANGSGQYQFNVPSGLTIDPDKMANASQASTDIVGECSVRVGGSSYHGMARYDGTAVRISIEDISTNSNAVAEVGSAFANITGSGKRYTILFTVPILGWNG